MSGWLVPVLCLLLGLGLVFGLVAYLKWLWRSRPVDFPGGPVLNLNPVVPYEPDEPDSGDFDEDGEGRDGGRWVPNDVLPEHTRYEIVVKDWGPDFTGEDGTLPRWRWVVRDADYDLKNALGLPLPEVDFFMVGNEATASGAWIVAFSWVERHAHPATVVVTP